ncbi:NUDIX hydrolase [Domibacillus epiphyticus]|uniref:ADP-ribose pyrophosphatase n=1 Tax=Domibacillus epiphyticus TaxID=1714355 RepID=A0A1V2A4J7_9BACI|nr:NUDIX hydrolase [Domibacillus epiphyticus]OMP65913.1 ADP-ribose pyrophosphatase [Domibacillus epiphyticus]
MHKFEEKTIKTESIFQGKVIRLQVDDVLLPDGKEAKRELIKHPGAVCVVALTAEKKIILVEQYRKALERPLVEVPAGKLEPGEEPELSARRELEEETGYRPGKMTHVQSFYTSPGFADELVHVFLAEELVKVEDGLAADEDEFVELMEVTIEEAEQLLQENRIYDAKTMWALQYLRLNGLV